MKIVSKAVLNPKVTLAARKIPVGTVFSGQIGNYDPSTYLRAYDLVVDLGNPRHTWADDAISVEDYQELNVELHIIGVK